MHDVAKDIKRQYPFATPDQLKKLISVLFQRQTGWPADPEAVNQVIAQLQSGEIR